MNSKRKKRIARLMSWVASPDVTGFNEVVRGLKDKDLVFVFKNFGGPAARIAWAEYGRRRGFIDFVIGTSVMEGKVHLVFEGEAKPLHDGPVLCIDMGELNRG